MRIMKMEWNPFAGFKHLWGVGSLPLLVCSRGFLVQANFLSDECCVHVQVLKEDLLIAMSQHIISLLCPSLGDSLPTFRTEQYHAIPTASDSRQYFLPNIIINIFTKYSF